MICPYLNKITINKHEKINLFFHKNNTNVGLYSLIFRIRNSQDYDSLRVVLENAQLQIFDTIQNQLSNS